MATKSALSFIDSDGHVLEHPTGMLDYAPKEYRDRIWHIETEADGTEWLLWDGVRSPANGASVSGTAGMSEDMCAKAMAGELRYTEVRPAAYNAKPRLADMDADDIAKSVLYPTQLLGIQCYRDLAFANAQCQAYNNWLSDHVADGDGRLFGAALLPQQDIELAAAELRRAAKLPGMVAAFIRPNPTQNWEPLHHRVYDPLWQAASESGIPLGLHPFLDSRLPGACIGMHFDHVHETPTAFGEQDRTGRNGHRDRQHLLQPGPLESLRHDELDGLLVGRRGMREVPRAAARLLGSQRWLVGAVARAAGPPRPRPAVPS